MLYIAENLKALRKSKGLTQEAVAEMLNVSPQSVSKWERGDTYPDITLLPTLANLYETSVDALIGMDKITSEKAKQTIFTTGQKYIWDGEYNAAVKHYADALKTFPGNESILAEMAIASALMGSPEKLRQAVELCERIWEGNPGERVRHTIRAASCFIYLKAGQKSQAFAVARSLPHVRESRETIFAQLAKEPTSDEINKHLKFIALGEERSDESDCILVEFGLNILPIITGDLFDKISVLRWKNGEPKLPIVRLRDSVILPADNVKATWCETVLMDKNFTNPSDAADEIIAMLKKIE